MLVLAKQGVRIVAVDQTIEIQQSAAGNNYQKFRAVPYKTNSDKGEATIWMDLLLFGDSCIEGLKHNDYLLVTGNLEAKDYIGSKQEAALEVLEKTPEFETLNYQGKRFYTLLCNSAEVCTKQDIQKLMGYGDYKKDAEPAPTPSKVPVADLEKPNYDDIPF